MRKVLTAIEEGHRKTALAHMKRIYCYETDSVYSSMNEAAADTGAHTAAICRCCKGTQRSANGYHFCYEDDIAQLCNRIDAICSRENGHKPLIATCINTGEQIKFSSRQEASQSLNIPDSTISSIIAGVFKQSRGWTFEDISSDENGYLF